uniref:Enoyl reductase (ER) domain-containing protein n=1 Tax=Clastoptera arizonana TaxID=38151 RepID=A0A1B6DV77_9HEMI
MLLQVLIQVKASGINPVDTFLRQKAFGHIPPLPFIIGKEAAGVVVEVASDVGSFKVGDRVVCCLPFDGGYAEYLTCNSSNLIPLSERLTFSQGAAIYVAYFTAYRSLITKGSIKAGELALIHGGSGAVGIASIQLAKSKGLKVVATAGTQEGLEIVKQAGADVVVNHRETNHLQKALSEAGSKGFDIILENKACANLEEDLRSLREGGRIAVVGCEGTAEINPRWLLAHESQVFGIKMSAVTENDFKECTACLVKGMRDGWVRPIIAKEYKLEEAKQAHEDIMHRHGARGKLVFVMDQ